MILFYTDYFIHQAVDRTAWCIYKDNYFTVVLLPMRIGIGYCSGILLEKIYEK